MVINDILVKVGADLDVAMSSGTTPIHIASQNGLVGAVRALIKGGAKVNKPKATGATPLYIAAQNGHKETVKALIQGGADVNQARNDGTSPVWIATRNGNADVLQVRREKTRGMTRGMTRGTPPCSVCRVVVCVATGSGVCAWCVCVCGWGGENQRLVRSLHSHCTLYTVHHHTLNTVTRTHTKETLLTLPYIQPFISILAVHL
jgi:hypothetical protein